MAKPEVRTVGVEFSPWGCTGAPRRRVAGPILGECREPSWIHREQTTGVATPVRSWPRSLPSMMDADLQRRRGRRHEGRRLCSGSGHHELRGQGEPVAEAMRASQALPVGSGVSHRQACTKPKSLARYVGKPLDWRMTHAEDTTSCEQASRSLTPSFHMGPPCPPRGGYRCGRWPVGDVSPVVFGRQCPHFPALRAVGGTPWSSPSGTRIAFTGSDSVSVVDLARALARGPSLTGMGSRSGQGPRASGPGRAVSIHPLVRILGRGDATSPGIEGFRSSEKQQGCSEPRSSRLRSY